MQVVINATFRTVPVLLAPFKGRLSQANIEAILAAFDNAEEVIAQAVLTQKRGDLFGDSRVGNAIVSVNKSRTMISRVVDEQVERRAEVVDAKVAAALVAEHFGCPAVLAQGGSRLRLNSAGRLISCGKLNPFTAEQLADSVPVLYTVTDNRGAILAKII